MARRGATVNGLRTGRLVAMLCRSHVEPGRRLLRDHAPFGGWDAARRWVMNPGFWANAAANAIGGTIAGMVVALLLWLATKHGVGVNPALAMLALLMSGAAGIAFFVIHRRYAAILTRQGPHARAAYDALRRSLTEGGLAARTYVARLSTALDAVDRFFGDAGMADRTLFPRAFLAADAGAALDRARIRSLPASGADLSDRDDLCRLDGVRPCRPGRTCFGHERRYRGLAASRQFGSQHPRVCRHVARCSRARLAVGRRAPGDCRRRLPVCGRCRWHDSSCRCRCLRRIRFRYRFRFRRCSRWRWRWRWRRRWRCCCRCRCRCLCHFRWRCLCCCLCRCRCRFRIRFHSSFSQWARDARPMARSVPDRTAVRPDDDLHCGGRYVGGTA
jgi:hypothetical protein